jgi:hypothetical protein
MGRTPVGCLGFEMDAARRRIAARDIIESGDLRGRAKWIAPEPA